MLSTSHTGASFGPSPSRNDAIQRALAGSAEATRSKIPGFANGGDFSGGVRVVGERGPELEFTGPSRIASHEQLMRRLSSPPDGNAALVAEIRALRTELEGLRSETRATATHSEKSARLLGRVINEDTLNVTVGSA